jgi:hypothetical protein
MEVLCFFDWIKIACFEPVGHQHDCVNDIRPGRWEVFASSRKRTGNWSPASRLSTINGSIERISIETIDRNDEIGRATTLFFRRFGTVPNVAI